MYSYFGMPKRKQQILRYASLALKKSPSPADHEEMDRIQKELQMEPLQILKEAKDTTLEKY